MKTEVMALFNGNIDKKDVDSALKIMKKRKDLKIISSVQTGYEITLIDSAVNFADETGVRYCNTPAEEIPERIIFVMTLLGKDNASKSYTYDKLREIIEHQSYVYKWEFFMVTDEPSNAEAIGIGEQNLISIIDGDLKTATELLIGRL